MYPPLSPDQDIAPNHVLSMVFVVSQITTANPVFQLGWLGWASGWLVQKYPLQPGLRSCTKSWFRHGFNGFPNHLSKLGFLVGLAGLDGLGLGLVGSKVPSRCPDQDIATNPGLSMLFVVVQITSANQVFQLGWLGWAWGWLVRKYPPSPDKAMAVIYAKLWR